MGLDGGTIISRTDVIRGASWRLANRDSARSTRGGQLSAGDLLGGEERVGARERREAAWSACALTGEALREPIVACQLGRLYNRESVLQLLLWRAGVFAEEGDKWRFSKLRDHLHLFAHIRSKRDIVTVELHTSSSHASQSTRPCQGNGAAALPSASAPAAAVPAVPAVSAAPAAAASCQRNNASEEQSERPLVPTSSAWPAANMDTRSGNGGSGASGSSRGGGGDSGRVGHSGSSSIDASHWICPLSGADASSGLPFSLLRPCGHAFSTRALSQLKDQQCPVCGKGYEGSSDVTPINPKPDQVELLQKQLDSKPRGRKRGAPPAANHSKKPC